MCKYIYNLITHNNITTLKRKNKRFYLITGEKLTYNFLIGRLLGGKRPNDLGENPLIEAINALLFCCCRHGQPCVGEIPKRND